MVIFDVMQLAIWRKLSHSRDHRWAQPRLSEYVDGELPRRQQRRLAAHEQICPDCHRVIATLRGMIGVMRSLGRPGPPVGDRVAEEVRRRIAEPPGSGEQPPAA